MSKEKKIMERQKEWNRLKKFSKMGGWALLARVISRSQNMICPICGLIAPSFDTDKKYNQ